MPASLNLVVRDMAFPEGPRWHDGALHFADHHDGTIYRLDGGALHELCRLPQGASGLGWRPNGTFLAVSMRDRRLVVVEPGGVSRTFVDLTEYAPGPLNDLVVDRVGRAYVGNFGSDVAAGEPLRPTNVLRVDPDGRVEVVADDLVFPNGMVITPDGRTLIVAESFALRLTAFDIDGDGGLSGRRTWAAFGPEGFEPASFAEAVAANVPIPDGLALDADGAVWVADPRGPAALRMREGGQIVERFPTGEFGSYAVALGGADRRTLFVCVNVPLPTIDPSADRRGGVLAHRVSVPGAGFP